VTSYMDHDPLTGPFTPTEPNADLVWRMTQQFLRLRPRWQASGESGDPGLCEYASHELVGFAASYGLDGEVVCVISAAQIIWHEDMNVRADPRYPPEVHEGHWVARFGRHIVDLTARQFDDALPFPFHWESA
jgi:hypothetical protein